ncbi:hypothetical protein DL769_010580 [Monosporascus sp. CRB-8-3]|nr:hypothetical protein DL769_010580 [Monosporascus sp. CRB-8-3]
MATSSAPQQIPRTSAWMAKQKDIEDFMQAGRTSQKTRVAYLRSAHASGKSTTLLMHLLGMTTREQGGSRLIYVVPGKVEQKSVLQRILSNDFREGVAVRVAEKVRANIAAGSPLVITTYEDFVGEVSEGVLAPRRVTIVVDVELRVTLAGELFFGILLELAGTKGLALTILLMAPHYSLVTLKEFGRVVGDVQRIDVPDINPKLRIEHLSEAWAAEALAHVNRVRARDPSAAAFLSSSDVYELGDWGDYVRISPDSSEYLTETPPGANVVVDPEFGVSLPWSNIRVVVSRGVSRAWLFDEKTSQIVLQVRTITAYELQKELSWAFKTTVEPKTVRVFSCLTPAKAKRMQAAADPWGPAWNADMPQMILSLFRVWPRFRKVSDLPIRRPPDTYALSEMFRRLRIVGCVALQDDEKYGLTDKGQAVLRLLDATRGTGIDFHAACLLSSVGPHADRPKVQRVIIRMAAIMTHGAGNLVAPANPAARPSAQEVGDMSSGVGLRRYRMGALWMALGVYARWSPGGMFTNNPVPVYNTGHFLIDTTVGSAVIQLVGQLETQFGIPPADNEIAETDLNDEEITLVEKELMWAWLHRTVGIYASSDAIFDVVSAHRVEVEEEELVDLSEARSNPRNRKIGGILAIYSYLEYVQKAGRKVLLARDLTIIPQEHFKDVEVATGLPWPTSVSTTYPLH